MKTQVKAAERDTSNCCPECSRVARRDEKLIDALQTARMILTSRDVVIGKLRDARVKAALDEALKLMGSKW